MDEDPLILTRPPMNPFISEELLTEFPKEGLDPFTGDLENTGLGTGEEFFDLSSFLTTAKERRLSGQPITSLSSLPATVKMSKTSAEVQSKELEDKEKKEEPATEEQEKRHLHLPQQQNHK